jgi:plasmid stabilization system protein ParE
MAGRVAKRREADNDLDEIAGYLQGKAGARTAIRFLDAADRACQLLADMPTLGARLESDHPDLADLCFWTIRGFRNYVIIYRPTRDGIESCA